VSKHEKIVALRSHQTIDEAIREIHGKFAEALASDGKAFNARLAAGQMLIILRERVEAGEAGNGVEWWPWYESKFVRSRKDAEKVMALARAEDPEAAAEEARARNSEHQRQHKSRLVSGRTNSQSDEQCETYDVYVEDLVDHAFRLVKEMDAEQQEQFIAKLKGYFKW
jgi:hypothetical protein